MKLFTGQIFPEVKINEEEQQHMLKVLRIQEGEEVSVTDGKGNLATGILVFEGKKLSLQTLDVQSQTAHFSPRLHVAIAPTKNIDRIEFFVEKATEMGISEITFLNTEKTERRNLNTEKIIKQSVAACKQSLRFHFPVIHEPAKLQDFIDRVDAETTFVCHCHDNLERVQLHDLPVLPQMTFLVGPEGDFSEKEIWMLAEKGIRAVSLGHQRLRTETAGVFIAAWNYSKMF